MDDLNRLLSDLETNANLRDWLLGSANESAADVVLADSDYDVSMDELFEALASGLVVQSHPQLVAVVSAMAEALR